MVWQFPVNLEIISNPDVRARIKEIPVPERVEKSDELGRNLNIGELRFGMK
ncbi:MAG: hypothetical protein V1850_05250 [Candidatus Bathyarchaeota archaeon]